MICCNNVVLKFSGEFLRGVGEAIIDKGRLDVCIDIINTFHVAKHNVCVVIGGGNIIRGAGSYINDKIVADYMGMLATIINGLAINDALKCSTREDIKTLLFSNYCMPYFGISSDLAFASSEYKTGSIVISVGGASQPKVTTDTLAALRGIQFDSDIIIKFTNVDGVYSGDPKIDSDVYKFDTITFDDVLKRDLHFADHASIALCKDKNIPIFVCETSVSSANKIILNSFDHGTIVY